MAAALWSRDAVRHRVLPAAYPRLMPHHHPPPPATHHHPNRPLCMYSRWLRQRGLGPNVAFCIEIVAFCIKSALLCLKLVAVGKCCLLHQNCSTSRGPEPGVVYPPRGTLSSNGFYWIL